MFNDLEAQMGEQKPKKKGALVIRILTVVALLLVIAAAVRYILLKFEMRRGAVLFQQEKYEQAIEVLEPLRHQMLASIGLRGKAERMIGLSKAEIASRIAMEERSVEGYDKALAMLKEAQRLAGPLNSIQQLIDEYTEYREHLIANQKLTPSVEAPAPVTNQ